MTEMNRMIQLPLSRRQPFCRDTNALQWNTDGWRISVNKIQITDGGLAIEKQTDRPVYTDRFDDQHIIISNLNGTLKNIRFR